MDSIGESSKTEVARGAKMAVQMPLLAAHDLLRILPHRHPFCFVDAVVDYFPGQQIVARKLVSLGESWAAGHFPGLPIFPGVLITEALAQTCGIFTSLDAWGWRPGSALESLVDSEPMVGVLGTSRMRFHRPVFAGSVLVLAATLVKRMGDNAFFDVSASCVDSSGELVSHAEGALVVGRVPQREIWRTPSAGTLQE